MADTGWPFPLRTHLNPLLLVQVGDIELLAWRMRQHLVVLLQDLVEALQRRKCPSLMHRGHQQNCVLVLHNSSR